MEEALKEGDQAEKGLEPQIGWGGGPQPRAKVREQNWSWLQLPWGIGPCSPCPHGLLAPPQKKDWYIRPCAKVWSCPGTGGHWEWALGVAHPPHPSPMVMKK